LVTTSSIDLLGLSVLYQRGWMEQTARKGKKERSADCERQRSGPTYSGFRLISKLTQR